MNKMIERKRSLIHLSLFILHHLLPCLLCLLLTTPATATTPPSLSDLDNTMLMFVGEDLDVVTVASRTPESPSSAPAVVRVVDHGDIETYGYQTLAQLLAGEPGFFMADQGMGAVPYLRGISSGILVLYDGVPLPTGGTRNFYPMDNELSLNNIKRVEIIRGPGSVLWGADAFAGIVNLVPFSGKDMDGVRVETGFGSNRLEKGFASMGVNNKNWDAYLSVYGARDRYHDDTFHLDAGGDDLPGTIDDSKYYEFCANATFHDCLSISGRFSDFNKRYTLNDFQSSKWASERKAPVNYFKANFSKINGRSHWNGTFYFQDITYEQIDAGYSVKEDSRIYYGELLWDRRVFEKGLLTAGLSYRQNHVDGALTQGGFMPDILVAERNFFVQTGEQKDYDNHLKSIFSQYRHPFSWGEIWLGGRIDDNSMYDDYTISYSAGVNIPCPGDWRIKSVFGTGYRTPYSKQLFGDDFLESEEVSTINLQAEWSPDRQTLFSLSTFYSSLSNHVQPDPYAGVSEPSEQDFTGVEVYFKKGFNRFTLFGSATKIFSSGSDYDYRVLSSYYIRPDGTKVNIYDTWQEPYDLGADFILSAGLLCKLASRVDLSLTAIHTSSVPYTFQQNKVSGTYNNDLLLNGEVRIKDIPFKDVSVTIGCRNLLDETLEYPGYYGSIQGDPLSIYINVDYTFR